MGRGPARLSVVIPTLDAAGTIAGQLEALSRQEWPEAGEVVVSDGGSTDATLDIVRSYADRLPGLTVVDSSARRTIAHGYNEGVRAASGSLLAFCEADDEVAAGWVASIVAALADHELVGCRHELEKLNPPWVIPSREGRLRFGLQQAPYPPYLPHASTSGLGVRRALFDALGGFDESLPLLPDKDFCFRAQLHGAELRYLPEAVVHYRYRQSLHGIFRQARGYAVADAALQRKYAPPPASRASTTMLLWPLRRWKPILRCVPSLATRSGRARMAWLLGSQAGRYLGSLRYRVPAI
jgi:GT2 family glycosyltransferase